MDELFGQYRLIEKLGEGGAGEVFLAAPTRDRDFARRGELVAIKRYKPEILKRTHQFDRIDREFEVGSTISHPHIVRMFEYARTSGDGSQPYLVMEYVDGVSLDKWIEQFFPVPRRLLFRFAEQLLKAVSELHRSDILHRDLKPQNIMVTSTFDLKVMDLGVVHIRSNSHITPENEFLGTIRNSSPELLYGEECDQRTDLYSIGTVFYALLHGYQLFAEETHRNRLSDSIRHKEPHWEVAIRGRDDVARALFDATRSLLSKSPSDRPNSADETLRSLAPVRAALVDAEPLHAYIATALTGLDSDARDAIAFASSKIADLAKEYDLYVYQPRKATDPVLHQDIDPTMVYRLDRRRVIGADLLIIMANKPSFGVGQEVEIASAHSVPTILLVRDGVKISRMVTGSPANLLDEIVYSTPEDLDRKLRKSLSTNLARIRQYRDLVRVQPGVNLGHNLATRRQERGFASAVELAESVGVSARLIEEIERGDFGNASLHLLDQIARALGQTLATLVTPSTSRPAPSTPAMDANLKRLENLAKRLGWNAETYIELRDDYQRQLAASGESAVLSESQWRERHNKLEERRLKESSKLPPSKGELFPLDGNA